MKRLEPHLWVASASVEYPRQQRKTEDKYRESSLEFSRFHGTTKLRKKPSFHTSWESLNRHDPNHPHSLSSDFVFPSLPAADATEEKNWEIRTFTCAHRATRCCNLQHTTWLPYNIPRSSDLIRRHDYICSLPSSHIIITLFTIMYHDTLKALRVTLKWLLNMSEIYEELKTNLMSLAILFHFLCVQHVVSALQAEACNTDTTTTQPHRNPNTHRTKNKRPMW